MLDLFDDQDRPDVVRVKVTPRARNERIRKIAGADASPVYRVYVTAAPEGGKANEAVIRLLSKALGISKSSLTITHGLTSPDKTIRIDWP